MKIKNEIITINRVILTILNFCVISSSFSSFLVVLLLYIKTFLVVELVVEDVWLAISLNMNKSLFSLFKFSFSSWQLFSSK